MAGPLFDALFLTALLVPAAMSLGGLLIVMGAIVVKHRRATAVRTHTVEATAH